MTEPKRTSIIKKRRAINALSAILLGALLAVFSPLSSVIAEPMTMITVRTFRNPDEITSIRIGSSVEVISSNAFTPMVNLTTITVSESNGNYASYSGCLYDKELKTLLCFPAARTEAYIPKTVTAIGPFALKGVDTKVKNTIKDLVESRSGEVSEEGN
ncbi:leucine-rich repeat protein [Butyrivibrio sp. MC2013]|uniref:leucine-rich repeat protein n=1 Tax=Butyrivibrio sp. MC2013 TaxID=1280686 RepID=UPI0012DDEFDE|nr:leucine-rich repeat protein [Butyrivibrio sp. MC2013]